MNRIRLSFMAFSMGVLLLSAGILVADRTNHEELYEALGNLAEVVHLVESEYVDPLNQEALALSLDAGIVESVDPWSAVLAPDQVDAYTRMLQSAPAFGLCLGSRLGSAAVRHTLAGSPAVRATIQPHVRTKNGIM